MSEFSTTAVIEARLAPGSVSSIESQLSDIGPVEPEVNATASGQLSGGTGGSGSGGGRNLASSQLDAQNEHLSSATDLLTDNIGLNEERNDLLRDLLDAQELTARESEDSGGRLLSGLGGLAAGGLAIAGLLGSALMNVNWAGVVSGAIETISVGIGDLIKSGGRAIVNAADLIADKASIAVSNLIDSAVNIGTDAVISSAVALSAPALIASKAAIAAADLIGDTAAIVAGDLIEAAAGISASDLIDSAAEIGPSAVIAATATITAADLIAEKATVTFDKIVDFVEGDGAESGQGSGSEQGTGSGSGGGWADAILGPPGAVESAIGTGVTATVDVPADVANEAGSRVGVTEGQNTGWVGEGADFATENPIQTAAGVGAVGLGGVLMTTGVGSAPGAGLTAKGLTGLGIGSLALSGTAAADGSSDGGNQTSTESSRGTPDQTKVEVSTAMENQIEVGLDISNARELERFLRDPEGYINDKIDTGRLG